MNLFWCQAVGRRISTLIKKIDYQFKNQDLLEAALTHRSVRPDNNERMEFLGDSIVNFIIAEALYNKFPAAHEGKLSRIRANLVKGDTLAELAQELELGDFIRLGPGELKSGGHRRTSILADTMEALIAALYMDGGMTLCKKKVISWFEQRLSSVTLESNLKDPKTRLQEYLQSHKMALPDYEIVKVDGSAHNQTFHVKCSVKGSKYASEGIGSSRRRAEQEAAELFYELIEPSK